VQKYIFKQVINLSDYLNFINSKFGTKFNSKSKSGGGRNTEIVRMVYENHINEKA
jgi:hypothetical protein